MGLLHNGDYSGTRNFGGTQVKVVAVRSEYTTLQMETTDMK